MTSRDVTARSSSAPRGPRDDRSKRCDALVQRQSPVLVFFQFRFTFSLKKFTGYPVIPLQSTLSPRINVKIKLCTIHGES